MLLSLLLLAFSCMPEKTLAKDCTINSFAVQADFNIEKFLGKWYEMKWFSDYYHAHFEGMKPMYEDFTIVYAKQSDGNISMVSAMRDPTAHRGCDLYNSTLYLTDTPAKLRMDKRNLGELSDYWIIKTDYSNFAVVYICYDENTDGTCGNAKAWVYSRHHGLAHDLMADADRQLERVCMDTTQRIQSTLRRFCKLHVNPKWRGGSDKP
ncbi:retinol-binding protein 4-like isoform X1 [Crassostrea virginica]